MRVAIRLSLVFAIFAFGYLLGKSGEDPVNLVPRSPTGDLHEHSRDDLSPPPESRPGMGGSRAGEAAEQPGIGSPVTEAVSMSVFPSGSTETGGLVVRVRTEAGEPLEGLEVSIEDTVTEATSSYLTGPDGLVRAMDLPPSRCVIYLKRVGGHRKATAAIFAGRTTTVDLVVPKGVRVTGSVRLDSGGAVEGATVMMSARGPHADLFSGKTDRNGVYSIDGVCPGEYEVKLLGTRLGIRHFSTWRVSVPDRDPFTQDYVVGIARLWGVVRDAGSREPVPGARVVVNSAESVYSDARGIYRVLDLDPGTYRLAVTRDGYGVQFINDVAVGEQPEQWDIDLIPAATMVLSVFDESGVPYVGQVRISFSPLGEKPRDPWGPTRMTSVATDAAGRVTYTQVEPGRYRFSCTARFVGSAVIDELTLAPGENVVRVDLRGD